MTRKRDRFFAGFGAMLFLITASAFTIVVIVTMVGDSKDKTTTQPTTACDQTQVAADALPLPEAYKPEGTVTELQSTDLEPGTGKAAKAGDCLQVNYYGTLADGTLFDENFDKSSALQFQLGAQQVITGWDEGLVGLKVGGTRRLVIPPSKAYGDQANGSIPANSTLVFVVKLVNIKDL